MSATATLINSALPNYCPTTNHYACSDGTFLLVTVMDAIDVGTSVEMLTGLRIPIALSHASTGTDVFLADELGRVLDADGDPANGMTPLAVFGAGTSFEAALAELGFQLVP